MSQNRTRIERHLVGGIVARLNPELYNDTDLLERIQVTPSDIQDPDLRRIFRAAYQSALKGEPVSELLLGDQEGISPSLLAEITSEAPVTSPEIEALAKKIRTLVDKQTDSRVLSSLLEELQRGTCSPEEALSLIQDHFETKLPPESSILCRKAQDIMNTEIPRRPTVLHPIIREKDLVMIHGRRGGGKSWMSYGMAIAIATGSTFLKWKGPDNPMNVLLIDGEMAAEEIKERLETLSATCSVQLNGHLNIISADLQPKPLPNLATPEGQQALDYFIKDTQVLIIDNLSSLCSGLDENKAEDWEPVQQWLLKLRRQGITVIIIHHAGKSGLQRGTSKREDVLNLVISIRTADNYDPTQGARFEVHFEKARGIHGNHVTPFEASLSSDEQGFPTWSMRNLASMVTEQILELHELGMSISDIAKEVGRNKSNVSRTLRKAKTTVSNLTQ